MIWGGFSANGRCGLSFLPKGKLSSNIERKVVDCRFCQRDQAIFKYWKKSCQTSWRSKIALTFSKMVLHVTELRQCPPGLLRKDSRYLVHGLVILKHMCTKEICDSYCAKLVESMTRKVETVLQSKGRHTKYWLISF